MRPSTIDELPEEIRAEIGRLRTQGASIDRIVEHLRGLVGSASDLSAPSRSAVGRHVKKMAAIGDRLRRSREVTEALVRELGDQPTSKSAQLNIELLHSTMFDLFNRADDDGTELLDGRGKAALAGNPEGVMMLAKALDHLTRASKADVEFVAAVEKRAADKATKAAASAAEVVAKSRGLTREVTDAIKAGIFGVRTS